MKYMGSKNRIAKYILPIILKDRKPGQWYVEPFVGGGNMIDKVDGNRIGSDVDSNVIEALLAIKLYPQLLPKDNTEFTEEDYRNLRDNDLYPFKGYAGFAYSYGAKWMGGWSRNSTGKRDYVKEAYMNAQKQSPKLQGVEFYNCGYQDLEIPPNSIIYCDPPYAGTTSYSNSFNHPAFWEWCREKTKEGHTVFVSEYNAPDDFECVWQMEIVSSLTKNTGAKTGVEKLFRYKRV
jgi:DNA adenine methylase